MSKTKKMGKKLTKISMSTALVASSLSFVAPLASAGNFTDVPASNGHHDNIMELFNRGIIQGYPDGTFKPQNHITRAHTAKIIATILELDTENVVDPGFSDVEPSNKYYPYIAALAQADIIHGSTGKYNPQGNITRGQMAKIIARAFDLSTEKKHAFKDIPDTHQYAQYIAALADFGVTTGKSADYFGASDLVTRAQLSSFVVRAEKATATTEALTGEIEKTAKNTLTIAGQKMKVSADLSFLLDPKNKQSLVGGTIKATTKNGTIIGIEELTLSDTAKSFDGKNSNITGKVTVPSQITTFKNIVATEVTFQSLNNKLALTNVTAANLYIPSSDARVASLDEKAPPKKSLDITNSYIENIHVDDENLTLNNFSSDLANILVTAQFITLNGAYQTVSVPANFALFGNGSIQTVIVQSNPNTLSGSIAATLQANSIQMNEQTYTGSELASLPGLSIGKKDENKPTDGSGSTGGNSGGGSSGTPGENTGGSSSETPGENTGGGSSETPGENAGGGSSETPGENAGGGSSETPGENAGAGSSETPGENAGGGSSETPGENAGGGSSETPGGNTGGGSSETPGENSGGGSSETPGETEQPSENPSENKITSALPEVSNNNEVTLEGQTYVLNEENVQLIQDLQDVEADIIMTFDQQADASLNIAAVAITASANKPAKTVNLAKLPDNVAVTINGNISTVENLQNTNNVTFSHVANLTFTGTTALKSATVIGATSIKGIQADAVSVSGTQDIVFDETSKVATITFTEPLQTASLAGISSIIGMQADTVSISNTEQVTFNETSKVTKANLTGVTSVVGIQADTVSVSGTKEITFDTTSQVTVASLNGVSSVKGIKADTVSISNIDKVSFDETSSVKNATVSNVSAIQNLHVKETMTINTAANVDLIGITANEIVINEQTVFGNRLFRAIASVSATFATTSKIAITLKDSTAEDLTINRKDMIVDTHESNTLSKVSINANNIELIANEIANVRVASGVTQLFLGTATTKAEIKTLDLTLEHDMEIHGYAQIASLNITSPAGKQVTLGENVKYTGTNNSAAIVAPPSPYSLVPTSTLGMYTLTGLPDGAYYAQYKKGVTIPTVKPSTAKAYTRSLLVNSTTDKIAIFDAAGALLDTINTDPKRAVIQYNDLNTSAKRLIFNTTATTLAELKQAIDHLIVYSYGSTDAGFAVSQKFLDLDEFDTDTFTFIPKTNAPNQFYVTVENVSSVSNLIIISGEGIRDGISTANKDARAIVLKKLAQLAKNQNNPKLIYDYLTMTQAIENQSYDSIFLNSIIDKLITEDYATLTEITDAIKGLKDSTPFQEIVPTSVLKLGSGITKISGDGTYADVTVEGSSLLINNKTDGTDVVTFKDATGAISLLNVKVSSGKITATLIADTANTNAEILTGAARLFTDGDGTHLIPASTGTPTVIYTPGADANTVGMIQSATTDANHTYKLQPITPLTVTKAALNLSGELARATKTETGFVTTTDALHFYPIGAVNTREQHVITINGKKTAIAIQMDTANNKLEAVIAEATFPLGNLNLNSFSEVTPNPNTTSMHAALFGDAIKIFASQTADKASFIAKSQDNKVTLINAETKTDAGAIVFDTAKTVIVKEDLTLATGVSIIAPKNNDGTANESVVRIDSSTIYATGLGTQRLLLTDGNQYNVSITRTDNQYAMEVKPATDIAIIEPATLGLQNIASILQTGSSATAINVENARISITPVANMTGATELTVTDADGKKAIVYVDVANGALTTQADATKYRVVTDTVEATDLGMAGIASIEDKAVTARGIKTDATTAKFFATEIGKATFKVVGTDNKAALINVTVSRDVNSEFSIDANVAKKDVDFSKITGSGLTAADTFATDASGGAIVRIEGNTLYALKEGTVDIAIKDQPKLFYRATVVKDDVTGQYSFTDGTIVSKHVFTATELGLTAITEASSSDDTIATVEKDSSKITLTTQTKNETGRITVTGPNGQAFVYIKKVGNALTAEIEKTTAPVDVAMAGLTNIQNKTWSNTDIVRSFETGTVLDFFVLQSDNTAYTVSDTGGRTAIINLPVTVNATTGHREIVPKLVHEAVKQQDGTATTGTIISGSSIRLHTNALGQHAYAIAEGETVVRLANNELVKYTVTIENGIYKLAVTEISNGLTKTDTELDLTGNLTVTGIDSAIVSAVATGNKVTFYGNTQDGTTSVLVSDGTKTVLAKVSIVSGVMAVTVLKHEASATATLTQIHADDSAIAHIDGNKIYALKEGKFEYVETDADVTTVKQLEIKKVGTAYTVETPTVLASQVYSASELGLESALTVDPTTYNADVLYAGMVGTQFVAYQKGDGSTDVKVKDGKNQSTLIHFTSQTAALPADVAFTPTIAKTAAPFTATDFGLDAITNITIQDLTIAEMHANEADLYLLKQGTTFATVDDGNGNKALATITVSKTGGILTATATPIRKQASALAVGATTVTALPGNMTNKEIVRISGDYVYAVGIGTTQVKLNGQIVNVTVAQDGNSYTLTVGSAVNFIEIPIADGTYTVADVTNTNAATVVLDDKGTPADKSDDQLIIYTTAQNGLTDLVITDSSNIKTLHHIKVANGVITSPVKMAVEALPTDVAGLTLTTAASTKAQVNGANLHLLETGNVALNGTDGLVNVAISRNASTNYLQATQTVLKKQLKEELVLTGDTAFSSDGAASSTLRALAVQTSPKVYYTANYRIAASTDLNDEAYTMTIQERHLNNVAYATFGLTHTADAPITLTSETEEIAKTEMNNGKLIIYAGTGAGMTTGTTTITAIDGVGKQMTIYVTLKEDGTITHEVAGQADAVTFVDLGLDPADGAITVTDHNGAYISPTVTATGINLSAIANGTTSFKVVQDGATKAIVNVRVANNASGRPTAVAEIVKADATSLSTLITGTAASVRQEGTTLYAIAEGTVLYDAGATEARQYRIVQNAETKLYSMTPTNFAMAKTAANLDIAIDTTTTLNVTNSNVVEGYVANSTLYIIGKSTGSTDITVTHGTDKAVVHAHMNGTAVTANVVAHDPATATPAITGKFTGNEWIQVRGGKLYALGVKASTIQVDGTFVTAEVTRDADSNEFKFKLTRIEHDFGKPVTAIGNATNFVTISGNTIYAKAVGKAQVEVDGKVRDVEVIANTDGTYKIDVKDALSQVKISAADLGLTLSDATDVKLRAITGTNIVDTQVIGADLYVYAKGAGEVELNIDGKTLVHVGITATNNVLSSVETIATTEITAEGSLATTDDKVRVEGTKVYGLAEGISLVTGTTNSVDTLYKVIATRTNNKLSLTNSTIETTIGGDASSIDNAVVRGTDTGELIAKAVGTETFQHDSNTYRVTVDAQGEIKLEMLAVTKIELGEALASISGTPASTLLTITGNTNTTLNVTATKAGTEIIQVSDGTNAVLVKVVVTDTDGTYSIAYELIKHTIETTALGFAPTGVTPPTNGIVKIVGSSVNIYPGTTANSKSYFTVTGASGTQAIYSLALDVAGVTLDGSTAKGSKVEALHVNIPLSELAINPTILTIDGTATAAVKTKDGVEVLEVTLKDTTTSHVIVKGEGGTYKSITVQAALNGASDYTTNYKVHNTLKLNTISNEQNGPIKTINDGTISVLYATATGDISYEEDGVLYNSAVTVNGSGVFEFNATPTKVTVALTNPRLVDGIQNIKADASTYVTAKSGTAIYATGDGYKEVVVVTDTTTQQYTATVNNVPSLALRATVVSATVLSAPGNIKVDGTVVYGGKADDVGKTIVISTIDGDGKVTLYKGIIEKDANDVISYKLALLDSDIMEDLGWNAGTAYTTTISDESIARIKDGKVYFMRTGETTITYKSTKTGLSKKVKYTVDGNYAVTEATEKDVIYYTVEHTQNSDVAEFHLTFDLNVDADSSPYFESIATSALSINGERKLIITPSEVEKDAAISFSVSLPEYDLVSKSAEIIVSPTGFTFDLDKNTFNFILKTN